MSSADGENNLPAMAKNKKKMPGVSLNDLHPVNPALIGIIEKSELNNENILRLKKERVFLIVSVNG